VSDIIGGLTAQACRTFVYQEGIHCRICPANKHHTTPPPAHLPPSPGSPTYLFTFISPAFTSRKQGGHRTEPYAPSASGPRPTLYLPESDIDTNKNLKISARQPIDVCSLIVGHRHNVSKFINRISPSFLLDLNDATVSVSVLTAVCGRSIISRPSWHPSCPITALDRMTMTGTMCTLEVILSPPVNARFDPGGRNLVATPVANAK